MDKCFIIMPITTPDDVAEIFDDPDHFKHVLYHLFIPAVEKAELEPVPPIAKGADLIQAEIIKNLESAELVLCDISTLNANVFFELGIRTALNKPVCYVKDDQTREIPFDTGVINHYTYEAKLPFWILKKQVEALSKHILESIERNKGENKLWKYFGLSLVAHPTESKGGAEDRIELLSIQLNSLHEKIDELQKQKHPIKYGGLYSALGQTNLPPFQIGQSLAESKLDFEQMEPIDYHKLQKHLKASLYDSRKQKRGLLRNIQALREEDADKNKEKIEALEKAIKNLEYEKMLIENTIADIRNK